MDAATLKQRIHQALGELDAPPWANGDQLDVHPVLNYGGFVNRSFKIVGAERAYHLKLTSDSWSLRGLARWRALHERLTDRYRAPAMRGWLQITDTPFAGPLFDWIDGTRPQAVDGAVRQRAAKTLRRLHADRVLARHLARLGASIGSCAAAYLATYHDRFIEDLKLVRADPPGFLEPGLIDWLAAEAESLAGLVQSSECFAVPADVASHRDLWLDNLTVTPDDTLFILDWDEIGLGDPMMDWAMLLGPNRARPRPAAAADLPDDDFSAAELERFELHARASLLDWIIDPLADWIEAAGHAEQRDAIRAANRRVSTQALERYRELYR
jgi:aminoglycoside phosphotransferase (APT) family kinase protein